MPDPHTPLALNLLELLNADLYRYSSSALPYFFTALGVAAAGGLVLRWERGTRISFLFASISALFTAWALMRGIIRMAGQPEVIIAWARYAYGVVCIAGPLMLEFIWVMLHAESRRQRLLHVNWAIAGMFAFAAVETPWAVVGIHHYSWGPEPANGPLGYLVMAWLSALGVLILLDARRAWLNAQVNIEDRQRTVWIIAATVVLLLSIMEFLAFSGVPIYPLGFLTVLGFNWMSAYITWRYGLIEVTKEFAAHQIAALSPGALLLLDSGGVIRSGNERTDKILGIKLQQVVGQRASMVLGDSFNVQQLAELAGVQDQEAEKVLVYRLPGSGDLRDLALSVAAVRDRRGRASAYACSLRDMTEQRARSDDTESDDLKDKLTGLPSRAMFLSLLEAAAQRAQKVSDYSFAVLIVGVDRLRRINEDLGFAAGDQVLAQVASRLKLAVRSQDALARVGGDEFGILMRRYSNLDEISTLADDLLAAVDLPAVIGSQQIYVSARIGIVTSQLGPSTGEQLLRNGSIAMFRAKENRATTYFLKASDGVQQRVSIESDLRRAMHRGELRVYYEPVVESAERRILGFEALVRWQHPQKGLILPAEFIAVAADVGLMAELDRFVLKQAIRDLATLRQTFQDSTFSINVNLSEEALRMPDLLNQVDQLLRETQLPPASLHVEVLEHVAQIQPVHAALTALHARGVELYLDDFGTGYSAMGRLSEIPAKGIKIDRSLVKAMERDEGGARVVAGIVAFARSLGLQVVAEGCSARREIYRLQQLGCRRFQGFYFTRAVPLDQLITMLKPDGALAERIAQLQDGGESG